MSSGPINEWVQMEPREISCSFYNDLPLTEETRQVKIKALTKAVESQNIGDAQTLASCREGLVNHEFRRKLCKSCVKNK